MKYIAILLVVVLLACVGGVGWLYLNANVTVAATGVIAVFQQGTLGEAEGYQFYTYTVRLNNGCFLTADMVEVQVTPMEGDVLQLGDDTARALPARTTGDIQATILTDVNMHAVRELNITYYMWGLPFTLRTTSGK